MANYKKTAGFERDVLSDALHIVLFGARVA